MLDAMLISGADYVNKKTDALEAQIKTASKSIEEVDLKQQEQNLNL